MDGWLNAVRAAAHERKGMLTGHGAVFSSYLANSTGAMRNLTGLQATTEKLFAVKNRFRRGQ